MAAGYGTATAELVAMLEGAGLNATADPRDLVLPGVWVAPALIDYDRLDGDVYAGQWELYLIAPDNGPTESLDALSELAGLLRAVVPFGEARTAAVQLSNHSPDPLPALQVTIELEVS